ncbi:MAG: glycogen/starch synthase [Bacteroidales bacterium]|nr:glycogen/starch synthase [Bacteroidales bacterium]
MKKAKVLYVTQEMAKYLPDTEMSLKSRYLPQYIQESGKEIRCFMPRYGLVNERRNQLHEVIRLSGMNLIIDDTDHPLIIKVASIQQARLQVYFIDNDEFFHRKAMFVDENGKEFEDNEDRMIFFARGVLETVKKLRWAPDIVHCQGWFTSLLPLYLKKTFYEDPLFANAKVVYSLYNNSFEKPFSKDFANKIHFDGITSDDIASIKNNADWLSINKLAIDQAEGIVLGEENVNEELLQYCKEKNKIILPYQGQEGYTQAYSDFYDGLLD